MTSEGKKWADGPFELISSSCLGRTEDGRVKGSHCMAEEMILVHNIFIRGANCMYLQCENVQRDPEAERDFLHYCKTWCDALAEHHQSEESLLFPEIERAVGAPGLMADNVEQHHAFHGGLEAYQELIGRFLKSGGGDGANEAKAYDGAEVKAALDVLMPALRPHLEEEIQTLLALDKYEDKLDWRRFTKQLIDMVVKKLNGQPDAKTVSMPFALQHHHKGFENGVFSHWPPVPWIVVVIFRWLYFSKHKSWWRFAPCDAFGNPQDLPFAS